MMLSPEYEPQAGFISGNASSKANNPLALSHPNLEVLMQNKQPPCYEQALRTSTMQGGMPGQQPLEGQYSNFNPDVAYMHHNRQQSMPASVASNYSNHLSPPHSNLSSHHVQSPPHSTGAMSPPNMAMSPPQSITMSPPQTSQYSISPPQQTLPVQSSQQHLSSSSPAKSRSVQLPTSPTHLQALRGATHQRHQASFDS